MKKLIIMFILICFFLCFTGVPHAYAEQGTVSEGPDFCVAPFADSFEFADVRWIVDADKWPGPNSFSNKIENIWKDELGQLHLKMTKVKNRNRWNCVEIFSVKEGWSYGRYEFDIEVVSDGRVDENVVIGLFIYDREASEEFYREIDFEFSRWGDPKSLNSQFVIQNSPRSTERLDIPLESFEAKVSFDWQKEKVIFQYQCGDKEEEIILPKNGENCKPPVPGKEKVYINLWLYKGRPYNQDNMKEIEIIIKNFKFTP